MLAPVAAAVLLSGSAAADQVKLNGRPFLDAASKMKPGEYIWEPELGAEWGRSGRRQPSHAAASFLPQWRTDRRLHNVVGAEAYVLESWDKAGQHWVKLHFSESGEGTATRPNESEHFDAPTEFRRAVHTVLRPGSIVVVTPASLRSGMPGTHETVFEG